MRRHLILLAATALLLFAAVPAFAQPSPVEEVRPIVVEQPVDRPAVPAPGVGAPGDRPAVTAPGAVDRPAVTAPARTVRVAGADQLARTGIDSGTAAGAAVLLLVIGGASVYAARRRAVWA